MAETPIDPTRRSFVAGTAALACGVTTGCAIFKPQPRIEGLCEPMPPPLLAGPEVLRAWQGPARHFDAHTHIFNARDVPVRGFMTTSVAHSMPTEDLKKLVIALAPLAQDLAYLAPTPAAELKEICKQEASATAFSLTDATNDLDRAIEERARAHARELFEAIQSGAPAVRELVDRAAQQLPPPVKGALPDVPFEFSLDYVESAFQDGGSIRMRPSGEWRALRELQLTAQQRAAFDMRAVFQFVRFMLSPRHHNLRTYIKRCAEGSPSLPLSGCFAAMVDFNYWVDRPGRASHLQDQVLLHEQLSLLSRGFMLPLVAYNPWADIEESGASLTLVERAIKDHGCVGVKIYPPMGFAPYNNVKLCGSGCSPGPQPAKLDERLRLLYELCDREGVPVMAHANESMGRDDEHDRLAGVAGWEHLRDMVKSVQRLYVNAGHFGGATAQASGGWTEDFIRLMNQEGRLRVYADLGYWDELLKNGAAQTKLAEVLRRGLSGGRSVAQRLMYGSDWLMLSQVPDWQFYGDVVAGIIRHHAADPQMADRVLGGNALECFGLNQTNGRKSLQRLVDNFCKKAGQAPGWLQETAASPCQVG
jgi:predicted TIM-barrel fold metal-dependent hydrolase